MRKSILYTALAAMSASALWSCSNEVNLIDEGEGTIYLATALNDQLNERSRASRDESLVVWISNPKGVVRKYYGANDLPTQGIKLISDSYVAEAWAGDSVPASFTDIYYKGREEFTIKRGDNLTVNINCYIANTVVTVKYDETIDDVLDDYVFTVGHSQGELEFVGRTDAYGYFMMNSRDKNLHWTLTGKLKSGQEYSTEGYIVEGENEAVKPTTLYTVNIKCTPQEEVTGGAYVTIDIDDSALDIKDDVEILAAPTITGINVDLNSTLTGESGSFGQRSLWINANGTIEGLILTSDYFTGLFNIQGNDFDLLRMTDTDLANRIAQAGISYTTTRNEELDVTNIKLVFGETFMNSLPDGLYAFEVNAIDNRGKNGTATFNVKVSNDPVSPRAVNPADVWATRATIGGVINSDQAVNPVMKYREYGTMEWTVAETTVNGNSMTAALSGLKPGTNYEFVAASDGFESLNPETFTTEEARQMPNSNFESSCTVTESGKSVICFYAEGEQEFWDSGNHGSATMSKMVTDLATDVAHSGHSLHMKSQFVGVGILGKFAAGNIFIGDYLATNGSNGVLGWGRPWNSRPAKLRGYVKYKPVAVTDVNDSYTGLSKGDMDNAIIYMALLDDTLLDPSTSDVYPVVVKTAKPKQLFEKTGSNVIAYGELVLKAATAGDGMIEFEIPLDYVKNNVKPTYIMCTMSASIGGDYFTGGNGSELWVDDLELVYE